LKIVKRTVGSSVRIRKNECQNIVEETATSETEKETVYGVRAMDVGALTILGTFAPTRPEEDGDKT
jgi:hypothetical protein